jgi:hypothetical protein
MNYIIMVLVIVVGLGGLLPGGLLAQPLHGVAAGVMPVLNRSHPLLRDIRGWWTSLPGLAPGNSWIDLVNRQDGTLYGMTYGGTKGWQATDRRGGYIHMAYNNDGVGYAAVPHAPNLTFASTEPFTMAIWYQGGLSNATGIIQKVTGVGNWPGYTILVGGGVGTAVLRIQLTDDVSANMSCVGTTTIQGPSSTAYGPWHHLVGRYDGSGVASGLTLAIDGQPEPCTPSGGPITGSTLSTGPVQLGNAGYFLGNLNDFRLWGRVLSDGEVAFLYQQSLLGDPALLALPQGQVVLAPVAGHPGAFFPFMR